MYQTDRDKQPFRGLPGLRFDASQAGNRKIFSMAFSRGYSLAFLGLCLLLLDCRVETSGFSRGIRQRRGRHHLQYSDTHQVEPAIETSEFGRSTWANLLQSPHTSIEKDLFVLHEEQAQNEYALEGSYKFNSSGSCSFLSCGQCLQQAGKQFSLSSTWQTVVVSNQLCFANVDDQSVVGVPRLEICTLACAWSRTMDSLPNGA